MLMSATMTSGFNRLAASTSSRPSSTIPTKTNSGDRIPRSPSTTMRWSSANSRRGRFISNPPGVELGRQSRHPDRGRKRSESFPEPDVLSHSYSPAQVPLDVRLDRGQSRNQSPESPDARTQDRRSVPQERDSFSSISPCFEETLERFDRGRAQCHQECLLANLHCGILQGPRRFLRSESIRNGGHLPSQNRPEVTSESVEKGGADHRISRSDALSRCWQSRSTPGMCEVAAPDFRLRSP